MQNSTRQQLHWPEPRQPESPQPVRQTQPQPSRGARLALWLIGFYQRWISAAFAPRCRYQPTCSSYSAEAVQRFGFVRGMGLALKRVIRCHPWSATGYDPCPEHLGPEHSGPEQPDTEHPASGRLESGVLSYQPKSPRSQTIKVEDMN